ncbi:MAG: DUF3387 domain-containing protein [bacterium]|nr:DUF3387 domain-containing protein [bacterium]
MPSGDFALDLVEAIRNSVAIDWTQKGAVRAKMRTRIKRLHRMLGYPPGNLSLVPHPSQSLHRRWGGYRIGAFEEVGPAREQILDALEHRELHKLRGGEGLHRPIVLLDLDSIDELVVVHRLRTLIRQYASPRCMQTSWTISSSSSKCLPRPLQIPMASRHILRSES